MSVRLSVLPASPARGLEAAGSAALATLPAAGEPGTPMEPALHNEAFQIPIPPTLVSTR